MPFGVELEEVTPDLSLRTGWTGFDWHWVRDGWRIGTEGGGAQVWC